MSKSCILGMIKHLTPHHQTNWDKTSLCWNYPSGEWASTKIHNREIVIWRPGPLLGGSRNCSLKHQVHEFLYLTWPQSSGFKLMIPGSPFCLFLPISSTGLLSGRWDGFTSLALSSTGVTAYSKLTVTALKWITMILGVAESSRHLAWDIWSFFFCMIFDCSYY